MPYVKESEMDSSFRQRVVLDETGVSRNESVMKKFELKVWHIDSADVR